MSKDYKEEDLMIDEDGEDFCIEEAGTDEDRNFDEIVGALTEFIIDPRFDAMKKAFFDKHCVEFEDSEENKLTYTPIFESWVDTVEKELEAYVTAAVPGFDMGAFLQQCEERPDQVAGDVFDFLNNLSDFPNFKANMIEHKLTLRPVSAAAAAAPAPAAASDKKTASSGKSRGPSAASSSSASSSGGGFGLDLMISGSSIKLPKGGPAAAAPAAAAAKPAPGASRGGPGRR